MNPSRTNNRSARARSRTGSPAFGSDAGAHRSNRSGSPSPRRSGGPSRQGGHGRRPAASGEFALPKTITPALPAVEAFADLDLPEGLLASLTAQGMRVPFPIQGATLPNTLGAATSSDAGAPARARPSPSAWPCWPAPPDSEPRPVSRWP